VQMTARQIERYINLIPEIRAAELIDDAAVSAFPFLTPSARDKQMKRWAMEAKIVMQGASVPRVRAEHVRSFFAATQTGLRK